ncbi:D-alanine--D-alanine ligase [Lactobacillus selangorensis]|uniref:D-alanine--D-alanine ligase n=1 Tax=Lactobacillus selangorensis TaxID=81857 RepID=A0A0R2FW67_9LACO|nr:D-alanine--D-alanine ligase [Lactobacillus selangorensis]KRN28941.1 D-alanine--D-alanine ligase [Lactobacillus selangorensis]KRN32649.1 D-alanine--D-alanine ligase [Lactobacillus selangorensis]
MKIVVLAGGRSTERNVSLSSGLNVANALRQKGHQVAFVDLFLGQELASDADIDALFTTAQTGPSAPISDEVLTDEKINSLRTDGTIGLFGKNVLKICQHADIVYMGLHGEDGENGKVQAVLDLFDIRYTGSGTLASGVAMNKKVSKEIMLQNHISTAPFVTAYRDENEIPSVPFDYPVVVKPSSGGSSVGTHIVRDPADLEDAVLDAFRFDYEVLIEKYIKGREFSLGIVNERPMPGIEIVVHDGWYDFKHKFQANNTTEFITPPAIDDALHDEMKKVALKTFHVLGMQNYGRIDFLLDDTGMYVIEANTLPGMTPLSLLPQEAAVVNISYADLCDQIVLGKWKLYEQNEVH